MNHTVTNSRMHSIDDSKETESLLEFEKRILEMLAMGGSLSDILNALCKGVEAHIVDTRASIFLVNGDCLKLAAGPSLPKSYTDAIESVPIGPIGCSCGAAAYAAEPVIITDIATDPRWEPYREVALWHGIRACWAVPIFSSRRKVIATFAMYFSEPRQPAPGHKEIVEQISHLAGLAIERRLTQDRLRESEQYLADAQRLSHTGTFVWDMRTNRAHYLSDEWWRVFGVNPEEGAPSWDALAERIHPDDREMRNAAIARTMRDNCDYVSEYRAVMSDGAIKHLCAVGHPVLNEAGEVVRITGSVTDITARKRAEEALQRSEAYLAVAQCLTATGSWAWDYKKDQIVHCSGELFRIYGLDPDNGSPAINQLLDRVHPDDRAYAREKSVSGALTREQHSLEYRLLLPDGTIKHIRSIRRPVLDAAGAVIEVIGTAMDVTERKRAENALRASEELARGHMEVMMRSLDVLTTEASPDKVMYEVLRTISGRLNAKSVMLWLRDPGDDGIRLLMAVEGDRLVEAESCAPAARYPYNWSKSNLVQEMLFTHAPTVCEDIEHDPRIPPVYRQHLLERGCRKFLNVPFFAAAELRGFVNIQHSDPRPYRAEEIELAHALAHHLMMAVHGKDLADEQRKSAILKERTRMARDIHDTLAQGFTGVIMQMEAADEALEEHDPSAATNHIRRAAELARTSLGEARRSVHALRPEALDRRGFAEALKTMVSNTTAGTSLKTSFELEGQAFPLLPDVEENLLRIGQEALGNVLKHAHATTFAVRLAFSDAGVLLELRDDGAGFDLNTLAGGGIGLIGMRERADAIGAPLTIASRRGEGTTITAVYSNNQ